MSEFHTNYRINIIDLEKINLITEPWYHDNASFEFILGKNFKFVLTMLNDVITHLIDT